MSRDITGLCREHSFEAAIDVCRSCGGEYCDLCLLRPGGKPLCKTCAMAAGGVRSAGTRKPLARRDIKRRLKAFEDARARRRPADGSMPVISDPLIDSDSSGPLPSTGSSRPSHSERVALDPDLVAQAAAQLTGSRPAAESSPTSDAPGGDIAPPIDWSRPFG